MVRPIYKSEKQFRNASIAIHKEVLRINRSKHIRTKNKNKKIKIKTNNKYSEVFVTFFSTKI